MTMIDPVHDRRPCAPLPEYQCHKRVRAAKIIGMRTQGASGVVLLLQPADGAGGTTAPVTAVQSERWLTKHTPHVGGYYVVYEDGYCSFSPAKSFEDGYTKVPAAHVPAAPPTQPTQSITLPPVTTDTV